MNKMEGAYTTDTFAYYRHRKNNAPTKMGIFKKSFKTISKEYCEESSICGLKHLVDKDTSWFERLIRILILIVGLGCSVSLVWMTFVKYYRAPLVTTQMPEGVSVSKIIFPAVGICSNNRISKRAVSELAKRLVSQQVGLKMNMDKTKVMSNVHVLPTPVSVGNFCLEVVDEYNLPGTNSPVRIKEERNKDYSEEEMMSLLFGLGQLYDLQPMQADIVQPLELHQVLGSYGVHELLRNLTPPCEDLLVRCVWNTEPMNCLELFDFRLTVSGYCCTFNYLRLSDMEFTDKDEGERSMDMYNYGNKSTFDFDQGLIIMLRLNESDDFFYNIPLEGAQLQFSDAYDFPDAPSGSFSMQIISPGVQMTVMVSASFTEASRDIQHVSLDLRKCRFHDESSYLPFYTYSDCILKCRMLFLLENCNCTPFNMPKMEYARTCDMRDVDCLRIFYAQSIAVRPNVDAIPPELELELVGGGVDCPMCCPTCSKTAYSYNFNNVNIYPEYLNGVPDEDRDYWVRGANFTGASIVHVKYAKEVADCYGRNVIMKWFDLISNIGSTCGFVTGFSFVSILEFIYFFTVKLIREIQSRSKKNNTKDKRSHDLLEPNSRFRPIYWNELTQSTSYANFHKNYD